MGCTNANSSSVYSPFEVNISNAFNEERVIDRPINQDSARINSISPYVPSAALPVQKYDNSPIEF